MIFAMSGDHIGCHSLGNATGDSAQHCIGHKTAPTTKNDLAPSISNPNVEKFSSLSMNCTGFKESTQKMKCPE